MRVLRLSPGLAERKGRGNGNPVVILKGTVPAPWDEMGPWVYAIACLKPITGSPPKWLSCCASMQTAQQEGCRVLAGER